MRAGQGKGYDRAYLMVLDGKQDKAMRVLLKEWLVGLVRLGARSSGRLLVLNAVGGKLLEVNALGRSSDILSAVLLADGSEVDLLGR